MPSKFLNYIVLLLLLQGGFMVLQSPLYGENINDRLVPGLKVLYFDGKYRHVRQVPDGDTILKKGRPGTTILMINHQFAQNEVFDSGKNREVGVLIMGYLHLDKKGSYQFQALSNDGVEVIIDGKSILTDPDVHSDRLSTIGTLSVQGSSWHPLTVKYFQRKGTAALKLFWKTPGKNAFEVIPPSAYGHTPDNSENK